MAAGPKEFTGVRRRRQEKRQEGRPSGRPARNLPFLASGTWGSGAGQILGIGELGLGRIMMYDFDEERCWGGEAGVVAQSGSGCLSASLGGLANSQEGVGLKPAVPEESLLPAGTSCMEGRNSVPTSVGTSGVATSGGSIQMEVSSSIPGDVKNSAELNMSSNEHNKFSILNSWGHVELELDDVLNKKEREIVEEETRMGKDLSGEKPEKSKIKLQKELKSLEIKRLLVDSWDVFLFPAVGLSGGIMILWRTDIASFSVIEASSQTVIGELNIQNKGVWMVATVYGNSDVYKRQCLWECLEKNLSKDIPTIVAGDFNCLLS
ncbi:hypothetical protein M5K25_010804 [Dendrobium thyrsiflorum]|uniref:Endonuclease/exonuclease/phosphatase domain-containing protein n=1 Tax=Dendrobium thyrsiflorum TaxID=117978 RepID=A0ABD0V865_DENTH